MEENKIKVFCVKYADSFLPKGMAFLGDSQEEKIPITFSIYLVQTQDKNILIDAGCDTMPGFEMKNFHSPKKVLETIGINAKNITDVIITHSHHDHIEAIKHFKNAIIHITEEEYQIGKKHIPQDSYVNMFKDAYKINEHISITKWGGHSKGSAIVEIELNNIIHVFAGDECYVSDCIKNKVCTGSYYDLSKSKEFVEKYSDSKYRVHTCHEANLKTERII